jgi:hypothetical protein
MVLLVVGCAAGFGVAIYGMVEAQAGRNPYEVAPSGVPKFVHGMPIHGLQFLPGWVLNLRWVGVLRRMRASRTPRGARGKAGSIAGEGRRGAGTARFRSVDGLGWLITVMTLYAAWQVMTGRGRFEESAVGLALLGVAGCCGLWMVVTGARAVGTASKR